MEPLRPPRTTATPTRRAIPMIITPGSPATGSSFQLCRTCRTLGSSPLTKHSPKRRPAGRTEMALRESVRRTQSGQAGQTSGSLQLEWRALVIMWS